VRYPADIASHYCFVYLFIYYYLSLSACSGSMREASFGSMMPAIIVYYLLFIGHCRQRYHADGILLVMP
jgi:hypothetical protein